MGEKIKMTYKIKSKKLKEKKFEWRVDKYKVYSFKNLPEASREKALENYREVNVDGGFDWWEDDFLIDIGVSKKVQAKSYKLKEGNTIFSWDKVYFDIDRGDYIQFHNLRVNDEEAFRQELGVPKSTWEKVDYYFEEKGERENSLEFYDNDNLTENDKKYLEKAQENFSELMNKSHSLLKRNYEYLTSEEAIKETFKSNDYKFTEDGKISG